MSLSKQEFTDVGRSMLGRAQAGETLTISNIVVGSGAAGAPSDLWPLTALIVHELDVVISSKRDFGNGTLLVEGNFRSDDAPHAFDLREVGIMAHIGTEADRLYSVANVFTDVPVHIDPAAPVITAFKIKLIVDRISSDDIIVQIGPSEAVTGENIGSDTIGPGFYKESIGNLQRFKRAAAGVGMIITEDTAEEVITFATNQLTVDVDLYVPLSYPSPPSGARLFATIQDAHDYLLTFTIPANKFARIHVAAGHYTQTIPIQFTHPNARQIQVLGQAVTTKTVSGTITRAGTLPNLDITVPIPSGTAGIAVNDVVYLYDAPHAQMESCGYVTQVLSTSVKIRMRIANVLPPASIAALGTTKLLVIPCQFSSSTASGSGVFNCPNGINLVKGFGFRSTVALQGTAIQVLDTGGALEHCYAVNYSVGFAIGGAQTLLTPVVSANACNVGIEVGPSGNVFLQPPNPVGGWARFAWSGNAIYGLWVVGGSYVTGGDGSSTYTCSNSTGIRCDTRGWVGIASATHAGGIISGWNVIGIQAVLVGVVSTSINVESGVGQNTTWDLKADNGAQISLLYNTSLTGNYSPALDTLGPSGGYTHIGALNPP
jgi:hypothetical protein